MHSEEIKKEEKNYYFFIVISIVIVLLGSFFLASSPFFVNRVVTVERENESIAGIPLSSLDNISNDDISDLFDRNDMVLSDNDVFRFDTSTPAPSVVSTTPRSVAPNSGNRVIPYQRDDRTKPLEPAIRTPSSDGGTNNQPTNTVAESRFNSTESVVKNAVNPIMSSSSSIKPAISLSTESVVKNAANPIISSSSSIKPAISLSKPHESKDGGNKPVEKRENIKSVTAPKLITNNYQPIAAYWVQIASFSSIDRARDVRQEMLSIGISIHIETIMLPQGKMMYRLRAGAWSNEDEAKRFMQMIRSFKNFEDAYITKSIMSKKI